MIFIVIQSIHVVFREGHKKDAPEKEGNVRDGETWNLSVTGILEIHNMTCCYNSIPMAASLSGTYV